MLINHLQEHNENTENNKYKNNIIIQGLEVDKDDTEANVKEMVTDFFSQKMKIRKNIALRSVLQLKRGNDKHVLQVTLQNIKDKSIIFKNVKNLMDQKNKNDENYYINDHLTFMKQEEQRRQKMIKAENFQREATDKAEITFKKGKLLINGEVYKKKVIFPEIEDTITSDNEEKIAQLYQTEGESVKQGNCHFIGISQEITNFDDIRCGYIKARHKHPKVLHIVLHTTSQAWLSAIEITMTVENLELAELY